MAVEDLGDYDVQPVDHNPFGAMADSPNNYDVAAVDHDPFASAGENPAPPATPQPQGSAFAKRIPGDETTNLRLGLLPGRQSLEQTPETSSDWIANRVYGWLQGHPGFGVPEQGQENIANFAGGVNRAMPWGSGEEGYQAAGRGDLPGTMFGILGAVPFIPGAKVGEEALTTGSRILNESGFYSHGADMAAQLKQSKGTVGQFTAALTKAGVKPEELAKSGLGDMAANMPITRDALVNQFERNRPQIQETTLGKDWSYNDTMERARQLYEADGLRDWDIEDPDVTQHYYNQASRHSGATHFESYQLPGGANYRELLLHAPPQPREGTFKVVPYPDPSRPGFALQDAAGNYRLAPEGTAFPGQPLRWDTAEDATRFGLPFHDPDQVNFKSSHWDTPNVIAHLRMSDRTTHMTPWVSDADALAEAQRFSKFIGEDWSKVPPADQARYVEAGRQELAKRQEEIPASLLHLEELQSDWGQQGREHGLQDPDALNAHANYIEGMRSRVAARIRQDGLDDNLGEEEATRIANRFATRLDPHDMANFLDEQDQLTQAHRTSYNESFKIPNGPFVGSTPAWTDLGLKRALTEAARGGHSGMIWTPGADQVERYPGLTDAQAQGLRGYYDQIVRDADGNPMFNKDGSPKVGVLPTRLAALAKKLDPAAKIGQIGLPDPKAAGGHRVFRIAEGGFGVRDAEFNELPNTFRTRGEAEAEVDRRNANPPKKTFPYLPITPLMRERILKGMPQYARGGRVGYAGGGPVQINAELRRLLALLSQSRHGLAEGGDPDAPDPAQPGFSAIDRMVQESNAAHPVQQPAAVPEEPQVYGGELGQAAERGYQKVAGAIGEAQDWLGGKLEQGVSAVAGAGGFPDAPGFARDIRAMVESGELGPRGEPREPVARPAETTVYSPYGATAAPFTRTGDVGGPLPGNLANKPVKGALPGFNDPNYPEGRISTSIPTNKGIADVAHANANRKIGIGLSRADPESYAKNAQLIQGYGLPVPPDATPEQAHKAFIDHATQNLIAIHDAYEQAIPGVTQTSKLWYDGGNNIVNAWADRYNRRPENVAGAIAAMSPKRDWDINVGDAQRLANVERMANIVTRGGNYAVDNDMLKWIRGYVRNMADPDDRREARTIYSDMQGKTLKDMSSIQKAWFVRAYDETHGPMLGNVPVDAEGNEVPSGYHLWNPDGTMGPLALNKTGTAPKQLTWASMDQLRKAIEAFEAESMGPISTNMGQMHKVRNFYNNLVAPNSQEGDVTVDTHAIAAAHLTPLGLKDPEVLHGLGKGAGASGSGATGAKGLYGAIVEAYRKAAAARGLLPRQMQSITWEAIRSLWNPAQKTSLKDKVKNWWQQFKQGLMTRAQVYKNIFQKGFALPRWMSGDARQSDEEED